MQAGSVNKKNGLSSPKLSGIELQTEIDRHWVALMMVHMQSVFLKQKTWHYFVLSTNNVFTLQHLCDIGCNVRKLSLSRQLSDDIMSRIIQYSLPYVKHNRLNFPRYKDIDADTLRKLISMLLAQLLGIYPHVTKHPVWQLRYRIFAYIHTLLLHGNQYDHYYFCVNNVNLLRIAVIEYFVYFVNTHMPAEHQMLPFLFGTHVNVESVFKQFLLNMDQFRATALQTDTLQWETLNQKAHVVIERCNRLCKGKPKLITQTPQLQLSHSNFDVDFMLQSPKATHAFYYKLRYPHVDLNQIMYMQQMHNNVFTMPLPLSITRMQATAVQEALMVNTSCYSKCMYIHVCFRCLPIHNSLMHNMRVDHNNLFYCSTCKQSDAVQSINVLGCITQVFHKKYYFCPFCLIVHEWNGNAQEFSRCLHVIQKETKKDQVCTVCNRNVNVNAVHVLDNKLGVMQCVHLCSRHFPPEHQQKYMHNINSLLTIIQTRMKFIYGTKQNR